MRRLSECRSSMACMLILFTLHALHLAAPDRLSAQEKGSLPISIIYDDVELRSAPPRRSKKPQAPAKIDVSVHVRLDPVPEEGQYPFVEVYLDGKLIGSLEHENVATISLTAGKHDLMLTSEGYEKIERAIHVLPGSEAKFRYSLKKSQKMKGSSDE